MIFVLGLIPVAGVIVSLIPLTVIAFNTGGITKVWSFTYDLYSACSRNIHIKP